MKDQLMPRRGLTAYRLKGVAAATMLTDHAAAVLLGGLSSAAYAAADGSLLCRPWQEGLLLWLYSRDASVQLLMTTMRWVGRLAFPLYCFLLVEGFVHTRSRGRYALRLGLFALLSEIPFDLAFSRTVLEPCYNNVFFTLLAAFMLLWALHGTQQLLQRLLPEERSAAARKLLYAAAAVGLTLVCCWVQLHVLRADYDISGILAVLAIYLLRRRPVTGQLVACLLLIVLNLTLFEVFALLTVPLVALYNGRRGEGGKLGFYLFYPLHLLVLVGLCALLGAPVLLR